MKTALKVLLLLTCFWSISAFAQIGPLPCGAVSSITTWRQDFPYLIGQVVILNGVTYQSLTNGNLNQNPCIYSGTQWSNIVGTGMGPTFNLANYTTLGLAPSGKAYVIPSQITGSVTDAYQAIDAAGATLPSAGGTIDATGLGTGTFTVTHQLTALNQPGKPVTLLLNSGTKFLINTSFATPTNTPASCAVPVGPGNSTSQGSAIVVPGYNSFGGNFLVGPSARVWDVVCNGDFTGNQETLRLDGVVVQGNSAATVMGSLMHLAGVFTPTHVDNSGTYQCFAQCLRLDAGTTGTGGSSLGDISFSNDHFSDTYGTGGTYPGSVVLMDALTSQGGLGNVNFFGGMIEGNGPHNALLVINGRGSVQVSGIGFFGTTFQTASATPSVANPNVDPIQLIDASQVLITNLRVAGNQSPTGQPNLVDISTTTSAKVSYGININQIEAFTGDFTCLVHNTVDSPATCETGYPTGSGDTTSANYTYGQVFPILRQTTYAPSGSCINGSLWGNSAGTTSATTNFQCVNNAWVGFSSGGGGGTNPAGSNTQVQFNNSGSFGADSTFAFNNSSKTLFVQNVNVSTLSDGMVKSTSGLLNTAGIGTDYISPAPGSGVSQNIVQQSGTKLNLNNVTAFNMSGDNWTVNELNTTIYVDGVNGAGINVNPVPWVSSTAYPWCTEVSHSGGNYIETVVGGDFNTTPGTNSKIWYPITNGSVPTQLDCAFYTAAATIVSGTGTVASGGVGATIILGSASPYFTNIGLTEPTVGSPASPVINIYGQGSSITTIKQGASKADGLPTLTQPHATNAFAFPSFTWHGFTVDSDFKATAVVGIYGAQHFVLDDLVLADATDGSDHYIEFGDAGDTAHGWVFEPIVNNVNIGAFRGFGTGAYGACTVSGGVPSCTLTNGGANYDSATTKVVPGGTSAFGTACGTNGTWTPTISSGVITAIIVTGASGCVDPVYPIIYSGAHINYGYKLSNVSDKGHWSTMVNGGIGWIAGLYTANITNAIEITNYHPESTLVGLQQNGSGTFINMQCDTTFQYCVDFEGAGITNLIAPSIEWNNAHMTASRDYYFGTINGVPGFTEPQAVNIYGEDCLIPAQQPGYAHFDSNQGVIDSNVGSDIAFMPTYVHDFSAMYCNQLGNGNNVKAATPTLVGSDIQMSNGAVGNYLNWNMGANFLNGGSQTITVTAPNSTATSLLGQYNLNFSNTTPATSGQNYSGPEIGNLGTYWTGSATAPIGFYQQTIPASGSNPLITFATKATGTGSSGGEQYTWDQKIVAPNVTDSALTSGNCVQAGTGGLLTTAGAPCGSGGANPAMTGYCTGTAPASSGGVGLAGLGGLGTSCASGTFAIGFIMPYAATLSVLNVRCGTTGVNGSSGVFTVYDSPSGGFAQTATGLTVTYGTTAANTNVSDITHTFSAAKGDLIQIAFSTQTSETIGYCSASVEY